MSIKIYTIKNKHNYRYLYDNCNLKLYVEVDTLHSGYKIFVNMNT